MLDYFQPSSRSRRDNRENWLSREKTFYAKQKITVAYVQISILFNVSFQFHEYYFKYKIYKNIVMFVIVVVCRENSFLSKCAMVDKKFLNAVHG